MAFGTLYTYTPNARILKVLEGFYPAYLIHY
jgi:hypothetical protein